MNENSKTSPTVIWRDLEHDIDHVMKDIEPLDRAYAEVALVNQLSKVKLDDELWALGYRCLMHVHHERCWQQCGWVWIQPTDKGWIENIALFGNEGNGNCRFIKILSVNELKALIVKGVSG